MILTLWLASAVAQAEEFSFEVVEFEKKPYHLGGYAELRPVLFGLDRNAALYHLRFFDRDEGKTTAEYNGRLQIEGSLEKGIGRVFARLSRSLRVPVTGKIRLGWDENWRNYLEVAHVLEDSGASLIAVHGRTRAQAYTGSADWDAISEVKQAVRVPVIGNGDVRSVADIARLRAHTGCDAVMIGRAAIGNPWIFARLEREAVAFDAIAALMRRHLALNLDFYGERLGLILFRKHAAKYIRGLPAELTLRVPLLTAASVDEFDRLLDEALTSPAEHLSAAVAA